MDTLIFTGRYKLEELYRERPLEYERLMKENRINEIRREYPGIFYKLFSSAFGLTCLLLGILSAAIIIWTLLFSG